MPNARIEAELKDFIVRDLLDGKGDGLDAATPLLEWGVIESFSLVRLVNHISKAYGVEFPFSLMTPANFETVSAIATVVSALCGASDARRALVQSTPGVLDSFEWRERPRPAPSTGQIEIEVRAAGINFRDVMIALRVYPAPDAVPGRPGECSGVVSRVGPGVTGFRPGEEVIAVVEGDEHGAFADHVVTDARLAARKPANLGYDEAAAFPIAFLTAHHALCTLARVERGERVLVHSAAGALGFAAVQLALAAGAEVLGTVGSAAKAPVVAALGVRHVFDNRTLEFADRVLDATGGRGVDVVLNSLPGPYVDKGLSVLAPFGRFVELGKTAIEADAAVGLSRFRNNVSYFAVDLEPILRERPHVVADFFRARLEALREGGIKPPPHTAFRFEDAAEAFRVIAQRLNVGKMVLVTPRAAEPAAPR